MSSSSSQLAAIDCTVRQRSILSFHAIFLRPICVLLLLIPIVRTQAFGNYNFKDENIFSQPTTSGRRIFGSPPISRVHSGQRESRCPSVGNSDGNAVANRFDEGNPLSNIIQRQRRNYQPRQQQQRSAGPPPAAFSGRRIFPQDDDDAPSFRFGPSSVGGRRIFPNNPTEGDDRPRRRIDTPSKPTEQTKQEIIPMTINLDDKKWDVDDYADSSEYSIDKDDDNDDIPTAPGYRILFNDDYDDGNLNDYQDDYPQANFRMFY